METDLFDLIEKVHDEKTFLQFLTALMKDREREIQIEKKSPSSPYSAGSLGWQNITIEGFLESAVAYAEDSEASNEQGNAWLRAAQIIHAGKTYE
ncbi:hypothetical protein P3339_08270 [Microbulbifer sp. MLAF003]|uniref:hypothetical protein n=1 Tax=unclassified Microbulbifer TaxID=2619833 RepID=UPI0024AD9506|nr:hypothetical protein [Microbulbifer sp. MLAF003]WHI52744.1 hypothetical protein P3339_08270 [Microbulbifer sp. MLAF003]